MDWRVCLDQKLRQDRDRGDCRGRGKPAASSILKKAERRLRLWSRIPSETGPKLRAISSDTVKPAMSSFGTKNDKNSFNARALGHSAGIKYSSSRADAARVLC